MGRWKVYTPETGYLYQGEKCSTGRVLYIHLNLLTVILGNNYIIIWYFLFVIYVLFKLPF